MEKNKLELELYKEIETIERENYKYDLNYLTAQKKKERETKIVNQIISKLNDLYETKEGK